jgi:hypothetical protein
MNNNLGSTHILATSLLWIAATAILLTLASCATTIPTTDTTQPEVRLTITGPGIGNKQMSNPPRDEWTGPGGVQYFNLQPDARYSFVLTVSDQGGIERAHMRLSDHLELTDIAPAGVVVSTVGINHSLTLTGSRSDPRTGLVITGSFTSSSINTGVEFLVEGDDFGGSSGRSNQRFMNVFSFVESD